MADRLEPSDREPTDASAASPRSDGAERNTSMGDTESAASHVVGTEPRWKFVEGVTLPIFEHDTDSICAPPSRVVKVDVVAERVFLTFADFAEDSKTTTLTTVESEAVSTEALLNALIAQVGVEWVQGLLRRTDG